MKKADKRASPGWPDGAGVPQRGVRAAAAVHHRGRTELIRCLPALRFDERVCEDAAGTPHEITHAPEALRYALMSREPRPPAGREPFPSIYAFPPPKREREGDYARFINY